jgi:hypothetical protein
MKRIVPFALAAPLFALAACGGGGDSADMTATELSSVRQTALEADRKAENAQQTAQQALEEARLANEKADRMFSSGLRK